MTTDPAAGSDDLYRDLFARALDAMVLLEHGRYVDVNEAACALFGLSREQLIGRLPGEFMSVPQSAIDAFHADGEAIGDFVLQRPDGTTRLVEIASRANIRPGLHLATLRDQTVRRSVERAHTAQRVMLEQVAELAGIGGWTASLFGEAPVWTPECYRICGLEPGSPITITTYFDLLHPDDLPAAREAAGRELVEGELSEITHRMIRPDGQIRWIQARGRLQADGDGTRRLIGLVQDVTEARKAAALARRTEERLCQAEKMEAIGVLAGGVAHDFNNITSVILGHTELVLEDEALDAQVRADLVEVKRASERAMALTRQLLAFARREVVQPRAVDLDRILRELAPMLQRLVGERFEIDMDLAGDAIVLADPGSLEQIIMNLVVNARDALGSGGRIAVETAHVVVEPDVASSRAFASASLGPHVRLTVTDEGQGMDATTVERVFEPFFTTKEVGKGTGLGLSTVFGIAQRAGGFVEVISAPNVGSTFRVYLPRHDAVPDVLPRRASERPRGGSETILLLEDDQQVRGICCRVLTRAGYRVLEAEDEVEAFRLCEQLAQPIDLLVSDVIMPRMNGPQVAERLSARFPSMKTLFMSGYPDDELVRRSIAEASVAFLGKPFTPEALERKVREILGKGADRS